jgi:ATP-dependent Clp protease ATP-binding subunit ClpA
MGVTPKGNDVFERFTDKARQTVRTAVGAAQRLNDDRVGDEHILLALAAPNSGVAGAVLSRSGVSPEAAELALAAVRRGRRSRGQAGEAQGTGRDGDLASAEHGAGPGDPEDAEAEALKAIGIDLAEVRRRAEQTFGPGALDIGRERPRRVPFSPEAKKILELALKEALRQHSRAIGTEHLLLGLLDQDRGTAIAMLRAMELSPATLREEVRQELRQAS